MEIKVINLLMIKIERYRKLFWIFALAYMLIVVMAQLRAPLDLYEYEFHPINGGPEENCIFHIVCKVRKFNSFYED